MTTMSGRMRFITLTTDFGLQDWFVGAMKGVIAGIAPEARVIDLAHEIPPGSIVAGAFALASAARFFPKGTVHLAVVDPGVGSDRKAIAVQTDDYFFVGPDNGVLSLALARQRVKIARVLENKKYFLKPLSRTFHGRDVFAPAAAHLSRGEPIHKLGPALLDPQATLSLGPKFSAGGIEGEVIYIDRFGNAITNLPAELGENSSLECCAVFGKRRKIVPIKEFYGAVPRGSPVAVFGSTGFLEIAVNRGSAEMGLGLKIGSRISIRG
jgi:S-adenosylmethionine hydrolase